MAVQQLEENASRSSPIVYHADRLNVPHVRAQLDNLAALLNAKEEDLSARLALAALASTIAAQTNDLQNTLGSVQAIEKDDQATVKSLNSAIKILHDKAKPQLAMLSSTYDQLAPTPEADDVRKQTLAEMAHLNENLSTLEMQLEDRLSALQTFEAKHADLSTTLAQFEQEAGKIDQANPTQSRQRVDDIQIALHTTRPRIEQLTADASNQLQSLSRPVQQAAALQVRYDDLDRMTTAAKDQMLSEERLQFAVGQINDLMANVNEHLRQIELVTADPSSSHETVNALKTHHIPEAERLVNEATVHITEQGTEAKAIAEFSKQLSGTQKQLDEMRHTVDLRLQDIAAEQELCAQMKSQLDEIGMFIDNLSTAEHRPQPLKEATEDRNLLRRLLEQWHTIDPMRLRNPTNRSDMHNRKQQIAERLTVRFS